MEENKADFQFKGYKILKSSIEIREDYKKFKDFDFGLDVSGIYKKSDNLFKLNLNLMIKNEDSGFLCEVSTQGMFKVLNTEDNSILNNYFYTNATALLFPYIRAYITNLTAQSGIDGVILPTMNLSKIVNEDFKDKIKIVD